MTIRMFTALVLTALFACEASAQNPITAGPGYRVAPATSPNIIPAGSRRYQDPTPAAAAQQPATATVGDNYLQQEPVAAAPVASGVAGCGSCGSCDSGNSCCNTGCDRYLRLFGGWNYLDDMQPENATAFPLAGDISFNEGWAIGASRGRQLTCNLRHEMEFVYRNNTGDTFFNGNGALAGNINCTSTQQVLLLDLQRLQVAGFRPYIGASLGGSYIDADFDFGGGLTGAISDMAFAYQGIAGVERQMSQRASVFVEYRYFRTSEVELEFQGNDFDVNYVANDLFFGFKIAR